tara:strand:+ start:182 stop:607 length:426 start_codon:yes stop_codon:yes gene_type:complete
MRLEVVAGDGMAAATAGTPRATLPHRATGGERVARMVVVTPASFPARRRGAARRRATAWMATPREVAATLQLQGHLGVDLPLVQRGEALGEALRSRVARRRTLAAAAPRVRPRVATVAAAGRRLCARRATLAIRAAVADVA